MKKESNPPPPEGARPAAPPGPPIALVSVINGVTVRTEPWEENPGCYRTNLPYGVWLVSTDESMLRANHLEGVLAETKRQTNTIKFCTLVNLVAALTLCGVAMVMTLTGVSFGSDKFWRITGLAALSWGCALMMKRHNQRLEEINRVLDRLLQ